ncbi:thiol peroxidase [Propionicimonas sp.]|uniref:thiol peroxidase n=1 Tax=Propionicimonas sp. TaxID=1955623 RepID=UPI0039E2732E
MATLEQRGATVHSVGELPAVGTALPDFTLTGSDMEDTVTPAVAKGRRLVLNIFPSIDTATCAMSVRKFNELAAGLANTLVLCVSNDLPAAQARFCGAEGIENVVTASGFRSSFGDDFGVTLVDGRSRGLLSRAVVVADADGTILYTQQVPQLSSEPDYEAALAALA